MRRSRILVAATAVVSIAAIAGCGASSSTAKRAVGPTATTAATTATAPSTAGPTTTPPNEGGSLGALEAAVSAGASLTYQAAYAVQMSSGAPQTLTVERKPPKSLFSIAGQAVINDGTTTADCTGTGPAEHCVEFTGGSNPVAGLTQLFSPTIVMEVVQAANNGAKAHAAGVTVTFSTQSFASQPSTCANVAGTAQAGTYCVTTSGVLSYIQSGGSTFTLTGLSSAVADSDFTISNVTMVTAPPTSTAPGSG
jgi:hypothetical protein